MQTFLSHRLYGKRPARHFDVYHSQPGWLFIEVGDWTLEIDYEPVRLRAALLSLCVVAPVVGMLIKFY